ncbi:hypothetical protein DFH06DRAFT_1329932 [Mycena polygramma]|nr:hypothetical protein DFH06DRAFT_1329932 [Mycena polygramma]
MVETQIARAHTLKIHFHGCENSDARPQLEIFGCLAKHASRWEELRLTLTPFLSPVLEGLRDHVPSLQRLSIEWDDEESEAAEDSIDCFESAPSLADVSVTTEYRFISVSIPKGQLTRYELDAPWEIHWGVLKLNPNLVEARVNICFDEEDWPDPGEKIELLFLRRLYASHSRVLTFLHFTLLEEISLNLYDNDFDTPQNAVGPADLADLESSLMDSSCSLRKLCFQGCSDAHLIAALLQKLCSVVDFAIITDSPAASEQAEILMSIFNEEAAQSGVLVPHLRRLAFGCIKEGSLNYGRFLELVKLRWEAKSYPLQSAALYVFSDPAPDVVVVVDGLNALREAGFDLVYLEGVDASVAMDNWLCFSQWN